MARKDPVTDMVKYAAVGTGIYVFYSAGRNGRFGNDIRKMMDGVHSALSPLLSGLWNAGGTQPEQKDTSTTTPSIGGGTTGGGNTGGSLNSCYPPYAPLAPMIVANGNLIVQMRQWQAERGARNENIKDWGAFRQFQMAIGAPDPGLYPPAEFCGG